MATIDEAGLSYLHCNRCQSVWIREPELRSLMDDARPGADNALLVHNDGTERRRCPICATHMDIAWMLFLQMQRCQEHGIWFDPGELERALGGDIGNEVLEQVNRQAKGRQQEEQKRRREQRSAASRPWAKILRKLLR